MFAFTKSHFDSLRGDLGPFILQSVEHYGGRAKHTNDLPRLETQWTAETLTGVEYLEDREQLTIRLTGDRLQQVTNYLVSAFGRPDQPAVVTPSGGLHGYYLR